MKLLHSAKRFFQTISYVISPPPEFHERLARNIRTRIEQEKVRDQWREIWNDKEVDGSCILHSDQGKNT